MGTLKYPWVIPLKDGVYEQHYDYNGHLVKSDRICNLCWVSGIIYNVNLNVTSYEITFIDVAGVRRKEIFPATILSDSRKIIQLAERGFDIDSINARGVIRHLKNELCDTTNIPTCYEYQNIGFVDENQRLFYAGKFLRTENGKVTLDRDCNYSGEVNLKCLGKYQEYRKFVNENIIGCTALEMALAIGFSGPLVPYLKPNTQISNLLIHTAAQSSRGKTTAGNVMASVFGSMAKTTKHPKSVFTSWGSTENGIEGILANNFGIPIFLDEFGKLKLSKGQTIDNIIYTVAEGTGKQRCSIEGKALVTQSWSTVIFSTGERMLFANTTNAVGLRMRVLDLRNITYTSSAEQATRINSFIETCSGVAGRVFVKCLLEDDKDGIIDRYEKIKHEVEQNIKTVPNYERVAKSVAIIMLAVDLVKKYQIFSFNRDEVLKLLVSNIIQNTKEEADMATNAYDTIKQIVAKNINKFIPLIKRVSFVEEYEKELGEIWGRVSYNELGDLTEVAILTNTLKSKLQELGFDNIDTVLNDLKEQGYLLHDKGKNSKRILLNGVRIYCYVIKIRD